MIFVILKHVTNDMQKIFLIKKTEKKYAFWCHTVTSGTNMRRLPQLWLDLEACVNCSLETTDTVLELDEIAE